MTGSLLCGVKNVNVQGDHRWPQEKFVASSSKGYLMTSNLPGEHNDGRYDNHSHARCNNFCSRHNCSAKQHLRQLRPIVLGQDAARASHLKDLQHRLAGAVVTKLAVF